MRAKVTYRAERVMARNKVKPDKLNELIEAAGLTGSPAARQLVAANEPQAAAVAPGDGPPAPNEQISSSF